MLQAIDTLIAFTVIMVVTSLLVTVAVQMFSALLSLRGKNLANALALTFQNITPALTEKAYYLASRILSDPILSDSTRTEKMASSPILRTDGLPGIFWECPVLGSGNGAARSGWPPP